MNDEKTRRLFNFTLEDVTTDVDKLGDNPQIYTLKAGEIDEFPEGVAALLEEKLAKRELWKHPPANKNREKAYERLLEQIRV